MANQRRFATYYRRARISPFFEVSTVGEKHHFSHPDLPPVDNVGFVINGQSLELNDND